MNKPRPVLHVFIAGLIAVPVLYVLSFGVAIWVNNAGWMSAPVRDAVFVIYLPFDWLANSDRSPEFAQYATAKYIRFWIWLSG